VHAGVPCVICTGRIGGDLFVVFQTRQGEETMLKIGVVAIASVDGVMQLPGATQ
jgi:hypothetical protein